VSWRDRPLGTSQAGVRCGTRAGHEEGAVRHDARAGRDSGQGALRPVAPQELGTQRPEVGI
jgi:hypothetical protein